MASPIASPQNAISMGIMNPPPSWSQWFLIAIPMCILLDLAIWAVLLMFFRPQELPTPPEIATHTTATFTLKQHYVMVVTFLTIGLWCMESTIEGIVGDMGVIAILPIVAFFGFGILTKDDWNSMLWSVVMLAMGGIALGKAVESSGLLHEIADNLTPALKDMSPFYCLALLSGIVVVVTSFISHTVGALIILPVVAQIGALLPDPRPRMLVMASALMCSGGMALPVSSFPNMNAISLEDSGGEPWLYVSDFLAVGILSSLFAWAMVLSVGYTTMTLLEFY
ncbi:low-affinity phosphate transporter [Kappamyces sp. JEL0680]|nr:low-affinity phosphate transporter [Kappamyces sp. JEL0680]